MLLLLRTFFVNFFKVRFFTSEREREMLVEIEDDFFRIFYLWGNLKQASKWLVCSRKIIFQVEKNRKRRKSMRMCLMNDAMLGRTHVRLLRRMWNHEVSVSTFHRIFHTDLNDANNLFPLYLKEKLTDFTTQKKFIEISLKNRVKNWFTCIGHFAAFSPFYSVPNYTMY